MVNHCQLEMKYSDNNSPSPQNLYFRLSSACPSFALEYWFPLYEQVQSIDDQLKNTDSDEEKTHLLDEKEVLFRCQCQHRTFPISHHCTILTKNAPFQISRIISLAYPEGGISKPCRRSLFNCSDNRCIRTRYHRHTSV